MSEITTYDAGLLPAHGGGNVDWWQDVIRAHLAFAHDHYEAQFTALQQQLAEVTAERDRFRRESNPLFVAAQIIADRDSLRAEVERLKVDKAALQQFFEANPNHLAAKTVALTARVAELETALKNLTISTVVQCACQLQYKGVDNMDIYTAAKNALNQPRE